MLGFEFLFKTDPKPNPRAFFLRDASICKFIILFVCLQKKFAKTSQCMKNVVRDKFAQVKGKLKKHVKKKHLKALRKKDFRQRKFKKKTSCALVGRDITD